MPWLLRDGEVLCAVELADGLRGRERIEGALLLPKTRRASTVGVPFAVDLAYCTRQEDDRLKVLAVASMARARVGLPRLRARCVLAAEAGAFARWGLATGDVLEVR